MAANRMALGFRAQRGGAVVVGVTIEDGGPHVLLSRVLPTAAEGDRLAFEPYHAAFEMVQAAGGRITPEVEAAVAEGRGRQEVLAAQGLADILARLRDQGVQPAAAALLVNRAGWITDLLRHALADPAHPPTIEGLAVRDALRFAAARCGLDLVELDEKSLPESAQIKLGLSPGELEAKLKALGAGAKPWRAEHRLACLAAWTAAAALR